MSTLLTCSPPACESSPFLTNCNYSNAQWLTGCLIAPPVLLSLPPALQIVAWFSYPDNTTVYNTTWELRQVRGPKIGIFRLSQMLPFPQSSHCKSIVDHQQ